MFGDWQRVIPWRSRVQSRWFEEVLRASLQVEYTPILFISLHMARKAKVYRGYLIPFNDISYSRLDATLGVQPMLT